MLDIAIVITYLLLLLVVGLWARSHKSSFSNFARVTDKTGKSKILMVATIFATAIGGGTTFGLSEKVFAENIAYSCGLLASIPIDLLIAKYVVPRITNHYGAESVGDIIFKYYGNSGRFITGLAVTAFSIGLLAAQISVSGRIFEYILQINYIEGVILSYSIVIIYTTIGGLRSVLFTNQLQFFAILFAIPIISIFGLWQLGLDNFIQSVPREKISFSNPELVATTISASLGFMVMNLFPTFIQRALINKDSRQTTKAIYIKSVIYAVFLIFITLNGLLSYVIYPEQKASLALPFLIDQIIPAGLQGLVIVGLLAAVMSTADSDLNVTSVTLVKDILMPIWKVKNQKKLLIIARLVNILIGSSAIIIAISFTSVVDLVIFISGFWGPVILVPLVFALFEITIPTRLMVLACVCGATGFILWENYFAETILLKGVFVGTMINLGIFILGKLSIMFHARKRPKAS